MKRYYTIFLSMILSLSLIACGNTEEKTSESNNNEQNIVVEEKEIFVDAPNINVSIGDSYVEEDGMHLKVFVANASKEFFTGTVHVTFCKADGKDMLGYDSIIVDNLAPGRECWADVVIDVYNGTPEMIVEFTDVLFVPVEESTTEVDLEITEKVKNSYALNFEGVSWYEDVTEILVYVDGSAIVTVKNDAKEKGQFYGSTIWSCGNQYGVETVQVVNSNGDILAVY